ncbi:MAG: tRNA-dihydrouridine synthase [Patescibacteria group bacterium]|jgi:nifR3 family TIM-barrel protein
MSINNKKANFWLKLKKPILALAPMAGVTDSAFRQICRQYGADVVYTEMVSADGLYYDSKKTLAMLKFSKQEKPVVIQLFGKYPERFTKAAKVVQAAGFDGIDINFGCPARKVAGHGGGVTLMRDLDKCRQIVENVLAGTTLPVSVKLRSSISKDGGKVTAWDFLQAMKDLPLAAVVIHGRPYEDPFAAKLDYEMIKKCVQLFKKQNRQGVVLGNGGINAPSDAKRMIELTGAAGVGLARGLYGRPWLFGQVRRYLKTGKYSELTVRQVNKAILQHARLAFKAKDRQGIIELRKHLAWYVSGRPQAKELRAKLVRVESLKELRQILKQSAG